MRFVTLMLMVVGACFFAGCASKATPKTTDFSHFCTGEACDSKTMSTMAGACSGCGTDLERKTVLKSDGDKVYVCKCPSGCKCSLDDASNDRCGCGKELVAFSTDAPYRCACESTACVMVSNKPGTCCCGKEMVKQ